MPVAENRLARSFDVSKPDKAWVADITCLWTDQGWLYLATVLDLFSRRIVGWAMDDNMRPQLVLKALNMAVVQRMPAPGLLHHTDRGSQYTSKDYQDSLKIHGLVPSMSRKGNCWDNAVAESFFSTLESELESRQRWKTRTQAKTAIFDYVEVFCNRQRRHSYLGNVSPDEFEKLAQAKRSVAA
jgi:transposase InsO family protein